MERDLAEQIQAVARCLEKKLSLYQPLIGSSARDVCKDVAEEFRESTTPPLHQADYIHALLALARCREGIYVLSLTATSFVNILVFEGMSTELNSISVDLSKIVESAYRDRQPQYATIHQKLMALKGRAKTVAEIALHVSKKDTLGSEVLRRIHGWTAHECSARFPYDAVVGEDYDKGNLVIQAICNDDFELVKDAKMSMSEMSEKLGYRPTFLKGLKSSLLRIDGSVPFPDNVGKEGRSRVFNVDDVLVWLRDKGKLEQIKSKLMNS